MANKYQDLSDNLIAAVGGRENITYFQHCTTRLRLNLKDRSQADIHKIEDMDKVLGVQWSNDELQAIIGPAVADAYKEICKANGMTEEAAVDENLDGDLAPEKKKMTFKGVLSAIMDGVSGSITPLIPMMIGGGMIKVINMLLNITGILPSDSTTYMILSWLGDAFIYFFPIFLGCTSARKFGCNQGIGMLLGGLLVYPSFIAAVTEGTTLTFLGLPVYSVNYANSVVPIILSVWVLSYVEKFASKISPDMLKSFLVPTLSLVIMVPVMLVVTAPAGYYIGTFVADAVIWLYETTGFFGMAIFGAILPLMIMTGMHTMMTTYWVNAFATLGYEPFFLPCNIISNWNQAVASFAVGLKSKNTKVKSTAMSCAVTAFIGGVTEPAMFGVTFKYKKPFYAAMIGNAAGCLVAGLLKVKCFAMPGSGGVFAAVTFAGEGSNLLCFLIAAAIGAVVTFAAAWILGIDTKEAVQEESSVSLAAE